MNQVTKHLSALFIVVYVCSCQQDNQRQKLEETPVLVSISCGNDLNINQQQVVNSIIADIKNNVASASYCNDLYSPANCPAQNISSACRDIFEDMNSYLRNGQPPLSFCITSYTDWYAAVDKATPRHIYLTEAFLAVVQKNSVARWSTN